MLFSKGAIFYEFKCPPHADYILCNFKVWCVPVKIRYDVFSWSQYTHPYYKPFERLMCLLQGADVRSHFDYLHLRPNRTHIHIDIMSKTYFGEHQIHLSASACLCQTAGEFEIISYQGIYEFADYFWKYVSGGRTPSRHSIDPYDYLERISSMQVAVGVDEKIVLYLTTHCWYHHGNANSGARFNSYMSYPVYNVIAGLCRTGLVRSGSLNITSMSTMSDDVSHGYTSGIYLAHHLRPERGWQFFQGTLAAVTSLEPI